MARPPASKEQEVRTGETTIGIWGGLKTVGLSQLYVLRLSLCKLLSTLTMFSVANGHCDCFCHLVAGGVY